MQYKNEDPGPQYEGELQIMITTSGVQIFPEYVWAVKGSKIALLIQTSLS